MGCPVCVALFGWGGGSVVPLYVRREPCYGERAARRSGEDAQELPTRRKVEKVLENLVSQEVMRGVPPVRGIVVQRHHPESKSAEEGDKAIGAVVGPTKEYEDGARKLGDPDVFPAQRALSIHHLFEFLSQGAEGARLPLGGGWLGAEGRRLSGVSVERR